MKILSVATLLGVSACTLGCSKNKNAAEDPSTAHADDEEGDSDDGMEMMQEFGGMSEEKVTRTFKGLVPELSACLTDASQTHRYLSGDVAFLVKVNLQGRAEQVHVEKSNLGSYEAERCMTKVLAASPWPKPVGGRIGLARWSIGFDAPDDERPPVNWASEEVASTLAESSNASAVQSCGGGGPFEVTAYVETNGSVSSAGIAHSDDTGEEAAVCLIEAVKTMTFESPGSWRAKVTFRP